MGDRAFGILPRRRDGAAQAVTLLASFDDGATWNVQSEGLPNTGAYDWTVPRVSTSQARVAIVVVFWVALAVYARTLTPTVPFWDSGEFIATSYTLGIPHPPGTPLYVMIGRLITLLPTATIAVRVNFLFN